MQVAADVGHDIPVCVRHRHPCHLLDDPWVLPQGDQGGPGAEEVGAGLHPGLQSPLCHATQVRRQVPCGLSWLAPCDKLAACFVCRWACCPRFQKLYSDFKSERFYWRMFLLARKLMLVSTTIMFNQLPLFQVCTVVPCRIAQHTFARLTPPFCAVAFPCLRSPPLRCSSCSRATSCTRGPCPS
jgi:hypothetical protein